ncbi:rod shape-determining protein RodA [Miltoncostaea oceani]|uniref:rod shape-determining protein RodA n=1 Tax=Miltoncostaea oceani TaxID=2843216 RepID=UPI001C3E7E2B|nr:rod shape-determining protein RodA [Miltoncostaea oceani]
MTTIAPPRSTRSGIPDRVRSAVVGMDWLLLLAVAGITAFSVFVIGKTTENDVPGDPRYYLDRQLLFVAMGSLLLIVAMRVNLERLARWAWGLWGSLLGALAVVFVIGSAVKGSNRWITIGPLNIQPSEVGKVAIAVILAGIAIERIDAVGTARFTLFLTGVAAFPAIVVFLQPDLGTSLVYGAVLATVLFLVGVPWSHFAVAGSLLAILILAVLWVLPTAGVKVLQDYQVERLTAFIGAERDTSDAGYQLDQSKTAIGSGGAIGKGPEGATQANGDFIPEHHTDFIFAVTSEMFGFVGGGVLILCFALVLWRGLRTMARASSQVDMLVAGAIVAMIGFQVFVNIGMTVGIMPITGIPLPLMSYGGSHTISTLIAMGLLLGIHQRRSAVPG